MKNNSVILGCRRLLVIVWLASLSFAQGQLQQDWTNPTGGNFSDSSNWESAVPSGDDIAWFNLNQTGTPYTVLLDSSRSLGTWQVANDHVVLNLDQLNLNLTSLISPDGSEPPIDLNWRTATNDFTGTTALMIGRGAGETAHTGVLTVNGGGTLTTNGLTIGGTSDSAGTLIVEGSGTQLKVTGNNNQDDAILGFLGHGAIVVRDGGSLDMQRLTLTRHSGATAEVLLQGAGSSATISRMDIGHRGEANVRVENGATLSASSVLVSVRTMDASLVVDNATAVLGGVSVGIYRAEGVLEVVNGGNVSVTSLRASTNTSDGRSSGTITVDGADSVLSASTYITLGGTPSASGGSAHMSISNGGQVVAGSYVTLWDQATLSLNGGSLTADQWIGHSGALLDVTLNTGEYDALIHIVEGSTDITDVSLSLGVGEGFTAQMDDVFVLFDYAGSLSGTFLDLEDGAVLDIDSFSFLLSYGSGNADAITLTVTAIPEPATIALLFSGVVLGLTVGLRRSRRRR